MDCLGHWRSNFKLHKNLENSHTRSVSVTLFILSSINCNSTCTTTDDSHPLSTGFHRHPYIHVVSLLSILFFDVVVLVSVELQLHVMLCSPCDCDTYHIWCAIALVTKVESSVLYLLEALK
jgi:hypothetical protein